ncbi:hypothetical protein T4C_3444 [Trichinella pseudospiralis]|uniref:Uncharacterized protein n=1 Tax=Trichinella pseudospiralis TaxID=6337 RepID=A0A0V1GGF1_TRIPS|nr:hypothetical protein T4C_3444 [Trichinella pseudospiralis]
MDLITVYWMNTQKDQSTHTLVFLLLKLHVVCEFYLGYLEILG